MLTRIAMWLNFETWLNTYAQIVCASRHPPRPLGCLEARIRRCSPSKPKSPLKHRVTLYGHRRTGTHDHAWTFAYTTASPHTTTTAIGGMASKLVRHAAWLSGCLGARMRRCSPSKPRCPQVDRRPCAVFYRTDSDMMFLVGSCITNLILLRVLPCGSHSDNLSTDVTRGCKDDHV